MLATDVRYWLRYLLPDPLFTALTRHWKEGEQVRRLKSVLIRNATKRDETHIDRDESMLWRRQVIRNLSRDDFAISQENEIIAKYRASTNVN